MEARFSDVRFSGVSCWGVGWRRSGKLSSIEVG